MFSYQENIRKTREQKNYTQEFMAESLDISQRAYSSIESGKTQLTVDRLFEISKTLQTSVSELLGLDNSNVYTNNFNNNGTKNTGTLVFHKENLEEIKNLYERIIAIKDEEITFLRGNK
ncbi:MAG: helix-turn-helix transcriptional regulator [Capnocytophaga sp.]|nr:helix-turn-helix transcriptional regulator [Capnocytophaga sp.]